MLVMDVDDGNPEVESNTAGTKTQPEGDLRERLLNHLAGLNDIQFKSQQIGEPELSFSEKRKIAEDVLNRSRGTFLSRFGYDLLPEHLAYFENAPDNDTYEVQFYVNKLKRCQCKPASKVQIKNRRFEAMKRLMAEGEYFSVSEMRKRNPLLFDQLLGNFLKNPATKIDSEEHAVAHILLDQIEQDQIAALKQSQIEAEMKEAQEYTSSDEDYNEECNSRLHDQTDVILEDTDVLWGKSYKNNHVIGKARWKNKQARSKRKTSMGESDLTQEEKMLLINEFTSSMFNSFLQGKDEYNYSDIDNNPEYDDVNQCNVDEEEKYFDSESPQEVNDAGAGNNDDDEFEKFMKDVDDQVTSEKLAESLRNMNSDDK